MIFKTSNFLLMSNMTLTNVTLTGSYEGDLIRIVKIINNIIGRRREYNNYNQRP